jgi:hypothetical protein
MVIDTGTAAIIVGAMITGGGTISAVAVAKILSNGNGNGSLKDLLERLVNLHDDLTKNTILILRNSDSDHKKLDHIETNQECIKTELGMHYKDMDHRFENLNKDMTAGLNSLREE